MGGGFYSKRIFDNCLIQKQFSCKIICISASTRRLYERKLSQVLESTGGGGDEQEASQLDDEVEEELSQPARVGSSTDKDTFRYDHKPEDPRARTSLSYVRPSYSRSDEHIGRSSVSPSDKHYTSYRDQGKDDQLRPHSSWSSSYLGYGRGLENDEGTGKPSPSWSSSDAQPATSYSWKTYGSPTDDSFRKTQSYGLPRQPIFSQVAEESTGYSARQRRTLYGMLAS